MYYITSAQVETVDVRGISLSENVNDQIFYKSFQGMFICKKLVITLSRGRRILVVSQ